MTTIWNDLRYAFRQLRKSPGFALAAVLTLALGIGVNAAVFTVFSKVLLHTMPVERLGELVMLEAHSQYDTGALSTQGGDEHLYFSYPAYKYLHDNNHVLDGLSAAMLGSANLVGPQEADRVNMQLVTGNYFNVMGLRPLMGRLLTPSDDVDHAGNPVAVLNENYWNSKLGSDPGILNQALKINGIAFTVVGVVRHSGLLDSADPAVYIPMSLEHSVMPGSADRLGDPLYRWVVLVGRLPQGMSRARAETELNTLWWNWRRDVAKESHDIGDNNGWLKTHLSVRSGARGVPVLEEMLGEPLKLLEAMALAVLLIACVNVANLLLVKAARKHVELAVRGALGASRRRIFQQVIAEGLLLGVIGTAAGLLLGWISFKVMIHSFPAASYLRERLDTPMDWKVLAFCIGAGVATSLLFSVAPALLSMHVNLMRALHGQSGSVTSGGSSLRSLFVATETALSLVLLMGAAVLGWNLYQLRHVDPGFTSSHVLTFRVNASSLGKNDLQVKDEYETIRNEVLRQPGVHSVAYGMNGLLTGNESSRNITLQGYTDTGHEPGVDLDEVSPVFFSTMQVPLLAGREFDARDRLTAPKTAIVDETFVKHYFKGDARKALGAQLGFGGGDSVKTDIQIVGVIPAIRAIGLEDSSRLPFIYLPYEQSLRADGKSSGSHPASFYVRTSGDPTVLAGVLHSMLRRLDRDLPMPDFESMQERIDQSVFETTLTALLASVMGGLALTLAAIGLYGVLAFAVAQRTREIGIRMALGADKGSISKLVLRQVGVLVAGGLVAGLGLALVAFRILRSRDVNLFGAPIWLYCGAGFSLTLVMLAASYLPARRASRVDPMRALRAE